VIVFEVFGIFRVLGSEFIVMIKLSDQIDPKRAEVEEFLILREFNLKVEEVTSDMCPAKGQEKTG
jgi:hypothetical protein